MVRVRHCLMTALSKESFAPLSGKNLELIVYLLRSIAQMVHQTFPIPCLVLTFILGASVVARINCILHPGKWLWIPNTTEISKDPPPKKNDWSLHQNASPYTFFPGCIMRCHVFLWTNSRGLPDHRATPPSLASVDLTYCLPGDIKHFQDFPQNLGAFFRDGRIFCMSLALHPLRPWPVLLVIGLSTAQRWTSADPQGWMVKLFKSTKKTWTWLLLEFQWHSVW